MTTLAKGASVVTLLDDMIWVDEYLWSAAQQERRYTVAGALVVDVAQRLAGRPITLQSGDDFGWITRANLNTVQGWANDPANVSTPLVLTLRGVQFDVIFDHLSGAIDARPVWEVHDPVDADWYLATLRLLTV